MMGIFQGNGSAPQMWSNISSIVLSELISQVFGIHFVKSFTSEIAQLAEFSYLDNCDMVQSDYSRFLMDTREMEMH